MFNYLMFDSDRSLIKLWFIVADSSEILLNCEAVTLANKNVGGSRRKITINPSRPVVDLKLKNGLFGVVEIESGRKSRGSFMIGQFIASF
jgi:hypothetical protein